MEPSSWTSLTWTMARALMLHCMLATYGREAILWGVGGVAPYVGGVAPTYEIAVGRPHVADGFWPASQSPLKAMDTNSTFRAEFGARYANTVTTRSVSKASQASSYCSAENATWAMSVPSAFRR